MTWLSLLAALLFPLAVFFWTMITISLLGNLRNLRKLPAEQPQDLASLPGVSVVFSARDEVDRVEQTVRMLLEHGPPIHEVIAVDDRSKDGTSEVLIRLAAENPNLKVVRIDELPERWLGKSHGLHVGAQAATSPWILFTDADVWMEPGVVGRAIKVALEESVDHVCLFPSTAPKEKRTLFGDAFVLAFGVTLIDVMSKVNRDDPRGFAGVGAFNLIRTELYRSFGGHEQLRLEVADDAMLGVLVRRSGGRTRGFLAPEDLECDYANGPFSLIKRLEKNHFAVLRYRVPIALGIVGLFAGGWMTSMVGPWAGTFWGIAAGVALFSTMIPVGIFGFRWSMGGAAALFFPLVVPVLGLSLLHSMLLTLRQGGVRWRDTFYPLKMLREGCLNWSPGERLAPPDLNSA